jgi:hypothetical protein
VLDHRAGGGEPGRVAGLGQNRGDGQRRYAGDRPGHLQDPQLAQGVQHPVADVGQLTAEHPPVTEAARSSAPGRWAAIPASLASAAYPAAAIRPQIRRAPQAGSAGRVAAMKASRPAACTAARSPSPPASATDRHASHVEDPSGSAAACSMTGQATSSRSRSCWTHAVQDSISRDRRAPR